MPVAAYWMNGSNKELCKPTLVWADSVQACLKRFQNTHAPGTGIAQWLERRTRFWKVEGSNPCRSGGKVGKVLFSRVSSLCWLIFRYPFHPRVIAVAHKRPRSFCQKCRWQVTAKHAYTLRMWLCIKWHGACLYGVHRTCAETAAVLCGTSHASAISTPHRWWLRWMNKSLFKPTPSVNCHSRPRPALILPSTISTVNWLWTLFQRIIGYFNQKECSTLTQHPLYVCKARKIKAAWLER